MTDDKLILEEVNKYIDYLEKPSENFGGMPVCPFVKKERLTEKLMLEVWYPDKTSFVDILNRLKESDYSSALVICMNIEGIDWEDIERKKYQKTIQVLMEDKGYKDLKALCFSPFEDWTVAGEKTREKSPYFLINLAETDALDEAHRSLWKTKYFDNFSEQELKNLKVYPKNKKVIYEKKNNKSKSTIRNKKN